MPDHANPPPPDVEAYQSVLLKCANIIGAFRWRLNAAGYPFREPPGIPETIAEIDRLCFPQEATKGKKRANTTANAQ